MDVLGSVPASFSRPLGAGGGGRFSFWSQSYFPFLLCLNRQIKGLISAKQTAPSPLATDWMTGNKSNRKTSAPSGAQAPSVIAVIPGSFYPPFPCLFFFFATQLGTNPIVIGDCREHRGASRASTELCFFGGEVTFTELGR